MRRRKTFEKLPCTSHVLFYFYISTNILDTVTCKTLLASVAYCGEEVWTPQISADHHKSKCKSPQITANP